MSIALYEASVFPLTPGGVGREEQQARRAAAYRLAASESLPRTVRVSAAGALEILDGTSDPDRGRVAVEALALTIYECRGGS